MRNLHIIFASFALASVAACGIKKDSSADGQQDANTESAGSSASSVLRPFENIDGNDNLACFLKDESYVFKSLASLRSGKGGYLGDQYKLALDGNRSYAPTGIRRCSGKNTDNQLMPGSNASCFLMTGKSGIESMWVLNNRVYCIFARVDGNGVSEGSERWEYK